MTETALGNAMAAVLASTADDLIKAKVCALLVGYDARWNNTDWRCLSVEEPYVLPLINPETGAASRTFRMAGKYDGVATYQGRQYLIEHKSCSEDIEDPNGTYWRKLTIDSQVSSYVLANWQSGRKLDGTLYDVIRKPTIRPKDISKADQKRIIADGLYCGREVPDELRAAVAAGQDRECESLYSHRLATDCLDNPNKYYGRRVVPRLDNEVVEFASELWEVGQSILHARNNNSHYRNTSACVQYATPCEYLSIWSGHDTPDSERWERVPNVHSELPILLDDGGRSVLTNSRNKCFQTCRRKHFLRYEEGIRRRNDEEREALVFGSCLHEGLEKWWEFFKEPENGNNTAAFPTNAAGRATSGGSGKQAELAF